MAPKYTIPIAATACAIIAAGVMWQASMADSAFAPVLLPGPAVDEVAPVKAAGVQPTEEVAVFAGGCFWGVQAVFQHVVGVTSAVSGYSGGEADNPTYDQVATGGTGYAEAVEVTYDPTVISYGTLLQVFFSVAHDPTEVDRQGPDAGTQYRSEIFTTDDQQGMIAAAYIAQLDHADIYPAAIATSIAPLAKFWRAEDEHQDYATLHLNDAYVAANDLPKLVNLRDMYPELWRDDPVLVLPPTPEA